MVDLISVGETTESKARPHWADGRVEQGFNNLGSVAVYFGKL